MKSDIARPDPVMVIIYLQEVFYAIFCLWFKFELGTNERKMS